MKCPICTVRPCRGDCCGHPLCAAAVIHAGLARLARKPRVRAINEARAIEAQSRAMAVALVERKAS